MDQRIQKWLSRDPDPITRNTLISLVQKQDTKTLDELFSGRLIFGTAGLRAAIGAGPMRMNRLVIRETTAGLATYVQKNIAHVKQRGFVVGYDGRLLSYEFAHDISCVLTGLGIKTYLFASMQPTPLCAFAVLNLGAAAGVMVTASHNPREYNGYKVYWENGAQIIAPHDTGIANEIELAANLEIPWCEQAFAKQQNLLVMLDKDIIERYLSQVKSLSRHPYTSIRSKLRIAYTPLHGVGAPLAEEALQRAGFTNVYTVAKQRAPDGNFPTTPFPNPEEPGVMDAVIALANSKHAELVFANDPDADRLAVAVRLQNGAYRKLSGNEIGILLGWDCMQNAPPNALVITSIVSSQLLGVMAKSLGVAYVETLTGFKWMANAAINRKAQGACFLLGFEEAYGYTIGELVRDKDGISAMVAFAELAAVLANKGQSIIDLLEYIWRQYGIYVTEQRNIITDYTTLGKSLRAKPPTNIGNHSIINIIDLLSPNEQNNIYNLPCDDVLIYELSDGTRIVVRPSGTEPKLKCYYELRDEIAKSESLEVAEKRAKQKLKLLADSHQNMLLKLIAKV
ncbi:MAG: phospho-sugar mutase [Deltaproteobacteria bacterium]|nr:phospho-sugar mutase [Deltaproteobacteria bacterium]